MRKGTFVVAFAFAFMAAAALAEDRRIVSVVGVGDTDVEPDVATMRWPCTSSTPICSRRNRRPIGRLPTLEVFKALVVKSEDVQTSQDLREAPVQDG